MVALLAIIILSGCYWRKEIEENQVGLVMPDGVHVEQVVGAGRYTRMTWYAEMRRINVSALTVQWQDPDLVTSDKQPIGFDVAVTFQRERDGDSIKDMWRNYNSEARNDDALKAQVLTRIPRVAKGITTKYSLDDMLGITEGTSRADITQDFFDDLEAELEEINVRLLDVGINNIAPSEQYLAALEAKANAQIQVEVARAQTKQKEEQLKQEQAQTEISVEQARRSRLVQEEEAKVFTANERWFALKRLEALARVIGDKDKIYFVPEGTDLSLFLTGDSGASPIIPAVTDSEGE